MFSAGRFERLAGWGKKTIVFVLIQQADGESWASLTGWGNP